MSYLGRKLLQSVRNTLTPFENWCYDGVSSISPDGRHQRCLFAVIGDEARAHKIDSWDGVQFIHAAMHDLHDGVSAMHLNDGNVPFHEIPPVKRHKMLLEVLDNAIGRAETAEKA